MGASARAHPDVVVVGGGPAGVAAAVGLARSGARVVLLERDATPRFKPGEILEPTVKYPLLELGLLSRFESLGSLPIAGNLSIWGTDEIVEADVVFNPHGSGYLVDRMRMEEWLIEEARLAGVVVVQGHSDIEVRAGTRCAVAWLESGRRRHARPGLVVDATGRGAGLIRGGGRTRVDALVALLAYVPASPESARDQRLYLEAGPEGWWYSAPLPDGRSVVAFMTDADLVPLGMERRLEMLRRRLAQTRITRRRVADGQHVVAVHTRPAMSTRRHSISGRGWVAIGDAASTYDPLSGAGVAVAMSKGTALARLVAACPDVERAVAAYTEAENAAFEDYMVSYRRTYARERRWPRAVFWRRRQGAVANRSKNVRSYERGLQ